MTTSTTGSSGRIRPVFQAHLKKSSGFRLSTSSSPALFFYQDGWTAGGKGSKTAQPTSLQARPRKVHRHWEATMSIFFDKLYLEPMWEQNLGGIKSDLKENMLFTPRHSTRVKKGPVMYSTVTPMQVPFLITLVFAYKNVMNDISNFRLRAIMVVLARTLAENASCYQDWLHWPNNLFLESQARYRYILSFPKRLFYFSKYDTYVFLLSDRKFEKMTTTRGPTGWKSRKHGFKVAASQAAEEKRQKLQGMNKLWQG